MHLPLPLGIAVVATGGAVGACLRELLTTALAAPATNFPWPTFAINVLGSFLLALLPSFAAVRRRRLLPPLLGTGVLGGFTTFSAYSDQTRALYTSGHETLAGTYLLGTLGASLVVVHLADRLSEVTSRVEFEIEEGDL